MCQTKDLSSQYLRLRQAVSETSGLTISYLSDCALLRELMVIRLGVSVSLVTLQRFYGFLPAKFHPFLFTLNTLAGFCGYGSWKDFCDH